MLAENTAREGNASALLVALNFASLTQGRLLSWGMRFIKGCAGKCTLISQYFNIFLKYENTFLAI